MRTHTASESAPAGHGKPRRRAGFTLTELMVSLVMFGIVSGIILGMIRAQQKFYRGATEVIDIRSQLRQAAAVIPLDLRSVSTVSKVLPAGSPFQPSVLGSDISYMDEKELRFRATIGSGLACDVANALNTVTTTPTTLASGAVLTSWYTTPAKNDTVFIFDPGSLSGAVDDQWRPYLITNIAASAAPCALSPLLSAADVASTKYTFTLASVAGSPASPLPSSIGAGTVMRFTRPVIYGLYEVTMGTSKVWYLGTKTMITDGAVLPTATGMSGNWEPIAGPFRTYSAGGATNGLALTYYDSTNVVTANTSAVARVDIKLRGQGDENGNAANSTSKKNNAKFIDSLQLSIAIRNRS